MIFPAGPVKRLHVDKAAIKQGSARMWTVRVQSGASWQTFRVVGFSILGPSVSVYRPDAPIMPEGTYAWIETTSAVQTLP